MDARDRFLSTHFEARLATAALDKAVADLVAEGMSRRAVAELVGVSHPHVATMCERAAATPSPPFDKRPVPIMSAARLLRGDIDLGEPVEVLVAFEEADILLESGLHPEAFSRGSRVVVPPMLLRIADGRVVGLNDCNSGYGGTGPSNTLAVLRHFDFPVNAIDVSQHRFLRINRSGIKTATDESLYRVSPWDLHLIDGFPTVMLRRESLLRGRLPGHEQPSLANAVATWVTEVLDRAPRLPWADGIRVARCYLDGETTRSAGLRHEALGNETATVIIEQGELQIWCPAYLPLDWTTFLSAEAYDVLSEAALYPDDLKDAEPRTWVQKLLARQAKRPAFIDISPTGQEKLARTPAPS